VIYVVKQEVTHPLVKKVYLKISRINGRDLRHAAELLPISDSMRRDIERTGRTEKVDSDGRRVRIEIIAEEKA
jgi:hypothetical protein